MNLRNQLKSSSAQSHARLDRELSDFGPFTDPTRYRIFLNLMLKLHQRCGSSLAYVESEIELPSRNRSLEDLIRSDLLTLVHDESEARDLRDDPRSGASTKSAETMWGEAYVMEGSAMGGKMMYRQAESLLPQEFGRDYLRQLSFDAGKRWKAFVVALESETSGLDNGQVIAAAQNLFDDAYSIFQTLKSSDSIESSS